jgi:hypothetical protein
MDVGLLSLFFFCACRQKMQKSWPHFRDTSCSVLPQQGIPQQGPAQASCIAARAHSLMWICSTDAAEMICKLLRAVPATIAAKNSGCRTPQLLFRCCLAARHWARAAMIPWVLASRRARQLGCCRYMMVCAVCHRRRHIILTGPCR